MNYWAISTTIDSFDILLLVLIFVFNTYSKNLRNKKILHPIETKIKAGTINAIK
jgi:hypothetical protein